MKSSQVLIPMFVKGQEKNKIYKVSIYKYLSVFKQMLKNAMKVPHINAKMFFPQI